MSDPSAKAQALADDTFSALREAEDALLAAGEREERLSRLTSARAADRHAEMTERMPALAERTAR